MKKFIIVLSAVFFAALTACSPGSLSSTTTTLMPAGSSLLIIDEAAQSLYGLDRTMTSWKALTNTGSAANDICVIGNSAYWTASTENAVLKLNLNDKSRSVYSFPTGSNPYEIATDGTNLFVTCSVSNQFIVLNKDLGLVVQTNGISANSLSGVAVGSDKIFLADSGVDAMYANHEGYLIVLSKSDLSVITNIRISTNLSGLYLNDGMLYVCATGAYVYPAGYSDGGLFAVDTENDYAVTELLSGISPIHVLATEEKIFAIDSPWSASAKGLMVFETNGTELTNLYVGQNLKGLDTDGENLYLCGGHSASNAVKLSVSNYAEMVQISAFGNGALTLY